MDEIDIPQYFLCPISLQIMKDPVTTAAGITYDRDSIQQWLTTTADDHSSSACPVTKQPLTLGSELTPNHMLRRLIQAWCVANADSGIDRIPTPRSPLHRSVVVKLIRDVNRNVISSLKKLDDLAAESAKNHQCMAEAGVAKAMILFIMRCFNNRQGCNNNDYLGIEEALRILQHTWTPTDENKNLVEDNLDFVRSILWVLKSSMENSAKTQALIVLQNVSEVASSNLVARLELDFFVEMVQILQQPDCVHDVKAALQILIQTCSSSGRNRARIVEAGGVFAVIEIELSNSTNPVEKKVCELVFCLLAELCSCAEGRQQFLKHAGGMAVAAKRLLRVSPAADDRVMYVLESIARFSATQAVVAEMLRVGAVSKLCMVLQADCAGYLKKKARDILRLHSNSWINSPCIQVYLLTMNPR